MECIPAAEIRRRGSVYLPFFITIVNMEELSFGQLRLEDQFLLNEAEKALKGGYGPYSKFHVGCSVRTSSEKVYLGANMDNASFGATICAERAALGAANTYQDRNVMAMAVIGKLAGGESPTPTFPCGVCRQLIYEFADLSGHDILIFCSNTRKDRIFVTSVYELLPKAFGPRDLGVDVSRYATP